MTPMEVTGLFLAQTALLALLGSGAGALIGTAVLAAVPALMEGLLPIEAISPLQPVAIPSVLQQRHPPVTRLVRRPMPQWLPLLLSLLARESGDSCRGPTCGISD